jgi:hypothetical protein
MFNFQNSSNILITKLLFGTYSLSFYKACIKRAAKGKEMHYPFHPAADRPFSEYFHNALFPDTSQYLTINGAELNINRVAFNISLSKVIKNYGRPELFNVFEHDGQPVSIAGYRVRYGTIKYKKLLFFIDNSFVMSALVFSTSNLSEITETIQHLLQSKNIYLKLPPDGNLLINNDSETRLVLDRQLSATILYNLDPQNKKIELIKRGLSNSN